MCVYLPLLRFNSVLRLLQKILLHIATEGAHYKRSTPAILLTNFDQYSGNGGNASTETAWKWADNVRNSHSSIDTKIHWNWQKCAVTLIPSANSNGYRFSLFHSFFLLELNFVHWKKIVHSTTHIIWTRLSSHCFVRICWIFLIGASSLAMHNYTEWKMHALG